MMRSEPGFHPILSAWFTERFGDPTDVQKQAWPLIAGGSHALIAAPTGSGKTLAALLPLLDRVLKEKLDLAEGEGSSKVGRGVRVLYVTPLKALNNDIHQHVFGFLDELRAEAERSGAYWPGVSVGVRTGDTSQSTRASMLRRPPDMLVTTPESLYILLTSIKAREILRTVRHVVVDEIHDLAGGDRGMHLSVSLERLAELCGANPQRIGVSATQKPPERIARYLGGWEQEAASGEGLGEWKPRSVEIVESRMDRPIELSVTVPSYGISNKREDVWTPMVNELLRHIDGGGTTLVFVSNRRLCERLSARLNEAVGDGFCRSHHGSVSRERRLETEQMLRDGKLRCLVATSSLELGIDIGYVDRVLQIDSPFTAASGIQRIGRSGHTVGGVSRGTIIVRSRGFLPEIAVLADRIARRDTEEIQVPRHSLGVIAQQIVAIVSTDDWQPDELYQMLQRSDSYAGFPRERFIEVLEMLAGFYPFVRPLIDWDREGNRLVRRVNSGMAAVMGAGTIPSSSGFPVYHAESRLHLGELDEEFVFESRVGDVFQLGASAWRIRSIKPDRIEVSESGASIGEIPFWRAEGQGRSFELSLEVGALMERLDQMLDQAKSGADGEEQAMAWLTGPCRFTGEAAESLVGLLRSQRAVSAWPTHKRVVIEWYPDETGLTHVVIHSWFGRKFNRTWLIALQSHLEQVYPHEFESTAKDNGIELIFREWDPAILELLGGVNSETVETILMDAVPVSPLFAAIFRNTAETSLLLSRSFRRTPAWLKRLRGQELLRDVMPMAAKFPLVKESLRECMEQSLDLPHLRHVLKDMEQGVIERRIIRSVAPSPLAAQFFYEFLNTAMYESDSLTRDLRHRLMSVSRELAAEVFGADSLGKSVDEATLAEERFRLEEGAGVQLRSIGDLRRLLKERGDTEERQWFRLIAREEHAEAWMAELLASGEIQSVTIGAEKRFICGDEAEVYRSFGESAESKTFVLNRFIETVVSFTVEELLLRYPALSEEEAGQFIKAWSSQGLIVPSPFAEESERGRLWTGAKAASRMIRATLVRSRGSRADAERYCRLLVDRHHLAEDRRLSGPDGVRRALEQLQGIYLPLSWWESFVLPARVAGYRREDLDLLCAGGEIFWLGRKEEGAKEGKIAFFRYDAPEIYGPYVKHGDIQPSHPDLYGVLMKKGASFLTALCNETGESPTELMPKLLDLVWQGLVANDQFAPVRLHGQKLSAADRSKFRSGLGRWYAVADLDTGIAEHSEHSVLSWTRHLLRLNGILTRAAAAEQSPYNWETHMAALGRMEELGIVTRGLLVREVNLLQFADKETADLLRQPTLVSGGSGASTLLCSADPASPYGLSLEWPAVPGCDAVFSRKPGNFLFLRDGRWLLWVENKGRKVISIAAKDTLSPDAEAECFRKIAAALIREHGLRKIVIDTWNGVSITETPQGEHLGRLGAEKDRSSMVIWPSSL